MDMLLGGTLVVLRDAPHGLELLLIRRPDRGSFAGAWVFPGGVVEASDRAGAATDADAARAAALRETREEVGLDAAGPVLLSVWTPPAEAPKRVRTWFFLARDPGGTVIPAPGEVVDWAWIAPAEILDRHARGELRLVPPTWMTVRSLLAASDVDAALVAASGPVEYATRMLPGGVFAWAGDAEHPDGDDGLHRLETATLPWNYRRA